MDKLLLVEAGSISSLPSARKDRLIACLEPFLPIDIVYALPINEATRTANSIMRALGIEKSHHPDLTGAYLGSWRGLDRATRSAGRWLDVVRPAYNSNVIAVVKADHFSPLAAALGGTIEWPHVQDGVHGSPGPDAGMLVAVDVSTGSVSWPLDERAEVK